ncbi:MAG: 2-C-methyl-D-erythritol 4-phosphate cytidylyltransferase, partial [Desulfovibrio sp.]|nr:2-C-methyl-D-erythritol 4-phosphate cytidylyltransferase [Desulfovibrio sp.]
MSATPCSEKPWALIMAAGRGSRLAASIGGARKQLLFWRGMPLYWHSAQAMGRSAAVGGLIFVFAEEFLHEEEKRLRELRKMDDPGLPWLITAGGERRQDSVRRGLAALPPHTRQVLVHDAARPFVSPGLIRRVCAAIVRDDAIVPALPVADTIKVVENSHVSSTLPRENLIAAQTPPGFNAGLLAQAHERAGERGFAATDDAALMEKAGHSVRVIA